MARAQGISWPRIGAESAAIVASILLAFAIDAWWADHQARSEEQRLLTGLLSEFQRNLDRIEEELNYRNAVIESILEIFDAAAGKISLQPESVDELIGDLTWWADSQYSQGALNELLQSGKLSLIEDNELRELVASLPFLYSLTIQAESQDMETARNVINPFLSANASLSQIANTMGSGRPGTGELPTAPVYPQSERQDHSWLVENREFQGILIREHWDHLDAISRVHSLQSELENGVQLIDRNLSP